MARQYVGAAITQDFTSGNWTKTTPADTGDVITVILDDEVTRSQAEERLRSLADQLKELEGPT